jgi:peptide/nickel transport system substrate-binding protein
MLKPIGTGPYAFESLKKDFEVVLKRFDGYWDAAKTPQYPDRIHFRIIKDITAQLQALRNNEIDYIYSIPPENYDSFFADAENVRRFAKVDSIYPTFGYIGWNHRREIWKDKRVRWAMSYGAVDIDKFIREVLKGRAERVTGDFYLYSPSYNPALKPIPYKPDKAAELLAEAGWWDSDNDGLLDKEGKPFRFEMLIRDMPPTMPAIQMLLQMQQNLKKLGIQMEIKKLEWSAFLEKIEKGDFDACRLGWALSNPPSHQDLYQIWHSSQTGDKGSNHLSYANPELDRLLEACRKELDETKRRDLEFKMQKLLYDEQPEIYLYMPLDHRAYNKKWRNVKFYVPRPGHQLNEWSLVQ